MIIVASPYELPGPAGAAAAARWLASLPVRAGPLAARLPAPAVPGHPGAGTAGGRPGPVARSSLAGRPWRWEYPNQTMPTTVSTAAT